jgi:hypothetical protein
MLVRVHAPRVTAVQMRQPLKAVWRTEAGQRLGRAALQPDGAQQGAAA